MYFEMQLHKLRTEELEHRAERVRVEREGRRNRRRNRKNRNKNNNAV